ncbi:hypothetical protein IFM89_015112 [Coptis chinensis]|uniref:eIF-4F 25 kDa subunit n=1 Tax=Coptis chinensis TaxID=261450 RepID=A0A835INC9_9MAGN|nr:hypothetical protein IFM89_015112 [Coptis chinensis]
MVMIHATKKEEQVEEEGQKMVDSISSSCGAVSSDQTCNHHPLEHAWTFWFDNPSAKSRQATWGSSIRPIYTFSTAELFWWYDSFSTIIFNCPRLMAVNNIYRRMQRSMTDMPRIAIAYERSQFSSRKTALHAYWYRRQSQNFPWLLIGFMLEISAIF